jgi:hypothetical protein
MDRNEIHIFGKELEGGPNRLTPGCSALDQPEPWVQVLKPGRRISKFILPESHDQGFDTGVPKEGPKGMEEDGLTPELQERFPDPSHPDA